MSRCESENEQKKIEMRMVRPSFEGSSCDSDAFLCTMHKILRDNEGRSKIDSRFARTGHESRYACKSRYPKRDKIDWVSKARQARKRKTGTGGLQAKWPANIPAKRD